MTVLLGPAAVEDISAACEHDRQVQPGLEGRFVEALDRLFGRLDAFLAALRWSRGTRRSDVPLRTFPLGIFYLFTGPDRIDVPLAIQIAPRTNTRPGSTPPHD